MAGLNDIDIDPASLTDDEKANATPAKMISADTWKNYSLNGGAPPNKEGATAFIVDSGDPKLQQAQQAVGQAGSTTPPDQPTQSDRPQGQAPLLPHEFDLKDHDPETLKAVAKDAGIDASKLPDSYFDELSNRYQHATDPDTLDKVSAWIKASGIGHFMHGMPTPGDSPGYVAMLGPEAAEHVKADNFFNANIQSRIIDKGQYIDGQGNYNPPASYKAGQILGDPRIVAGALIGGAASRGALLGLAGVARATSAYAAANPVAGTLLKALVHGTAIGAAMRLFGPSGSSPPPPP
jgi:hypothetical protein